jgi:hypothetical protein
MMYVEMKRNELWQNLLKEGQTQSSIVLSEDQEAYLAFALQRFVTRCELVSITLALAYLESFCFGPRHRKLALSDAGDAGLLLAGLFPERAKRLNVSSSYFMEMSKVCFFDLAEVCEQLRHKGEAELYRDIGHNIQKLTRVLSSTRAHKQTDTQVFTFCSNESLQ